MVKREELLVYGVLFGLATLLSLPAFVYVFPNGDDLAQHYFWTIEFTKELREGVLYPRWLSGAYAGRGSPVMFYYPPLPLYASSLFALIIDDTLPAIALSCWLALLLSGVAAYVLCRSFLSRAASLAAAAFYLTLHYHLFDLYQRAALNEYWAFVWVPLVFHSTYRVLCMDGWRSVPYVAFSYALLMLTHLPTALTCSLALPVFALVLSRNVLRLAAAAGGTVLGTGLAGVFVSSVLFERDYLRSVRGLGRPRYEHGFLLGDLGSLFTRVPFPSSGDYDRFISASFWIAGGFLILLSVLIVVIWRAGREGGNGLARHNVTLAAVAVAVVSFFMTTPVSSPLWRVVPFLRSIQFPVRWFVITSVAAAVLVGVCCSMVLGSRISRAGILSLALALLPSLAITVLVIARAPYQREALERRLERYTDVMEYHTRWWDEQRDRELDESAVVVAAGEAKVDPVDESGIKQKYSINANGTARLRFRTLYFPGWVAKVNGKETPVQPADDGHIQLWVQDGESSLTLSLEDTPPRRAGKIVSLLGVLGCVSLLVAGRSARLPRPGEEGEGRNEDRPVGKSRKGQRRRNRTTRRPQSH